MLTVIAGICTILLTGIISLFISNEKRSARLGALGIIAGSLPCIIVAIHVLLSGSELSLKIPWQVPYGSFYLVIDSLSALFLIPIFIVCSVSAIYGFEYMAEHKGQRLKASIFFFNVLAASMAMVVMARNGILFLVAWEAMSLSSYFLVIFDNEKESVRKAGWIYIVATHIGTAFLFTFFVLLGTCNGTMNFDNVDISGTISSVLFLLALVGFGTKAGIMPFHVWLPEAHPAAPSHVSAVMSGVMIKTGIYGIIRTLMILPAPPAWWGWLLIGIGAVSGVFGVLLALAQHDFKRLLAYSSVENIGIIILGLGVGSIGLSYSSNILAIAGFAGALLHVINHAFFKGLLFLGAGAVIRATGTGSIDILGGLIKRMPQTALTFAIGAIAICGLPPLNGFISEFLIYYGSFTAITAGSTKVVLAAVLGIGALAFIGGLALACFTKAFGFIFLGEPRSEKTVRANEVGSAMKLPMWILACSCIAIGFLSPFIISAMTSVVTNITGIDSIAVTEQFHSVENILFNVVLISVLLVLFILIISYARRSLMKTNKIQKSGTWDCGYVRPTPRMQYTASSFAQPIVTIFKIFLQTHHKVKMPETFFPQQASYDSHTPDLSNKFLFKPLFSWTAVILSKLHWIQFGIVQVYVLYIAITLLILLAWKL